MKSIRKKFHQLVCEHTARYFGEDTVNGVTTKKYQCYKCGKIISQKVTRGD